MLTTPPGYVSLTTGLRNYYEQRNVPEEVKMDDVHTIVSQGEKYKEDRKTIPLVAMAWVHLQRMQKLIDNNPDPTVKQISCRRGCSFCCHMNVDITEDEGHYLIHYCQTHGIEIDEEYLVKQLPLKMETHMMSPHSACVFLKSGECSVYEARPHACRKYFALFDPILCSSESLSAQQGFLFNRKVELYASALLQASTTGHMAEMLLHLLHQQRKPTHGTIHLPDQREEL